VDEQSKIDDLCDVRASVRALRKEVQKRHIALNDARDKLRKATSRLEDVLTEIEQHQGRLPFVEDQPAVAAEAAPSNGNGKRKARRRETAAARA
jgi:predicted  nucleic acid-binding Zn-ribbon protein